MVLTASLGALPNYVDLDVIKEEVGDLLSSKLGIDQVEVHEGAVVSTEQPTDAQHETLEAARLGSIASYENNYTKIQKLEAQIELLATKNESLINVLKANGLMESGVA